VDDLEQAAAAVGRVAALSRWRCRQVFEECFTAARMAQDYLALYRRFLARRAPVDGMWRSKPAHGDGWTRPAAGRAGSISPRTLLPSKG
jgi:hypothetical protein